MAKRKTARQIAAAKRNLAKARAKKKRFHARNRKKFNRRSYKRRDLAEYKNTGLAMVKGNPNRTWRGVNKSLRKGSRHNLRYERKLRKHRKRIAKYKSRLR